MAELELGAFSEAGVGVRPLACRVDDEEKPELEGDIDKGVPELDDGPASAEDVDAEEGPATEPAACNAPKANAPLGETTLVPRLDSEGILTWSDLVIVGGDVFLGEAFPVPLPFGFGRNKIPVGCPSGLWITNPEEGFVPRLVGK
jgi:hypothetical protein